MVLEEYQKRLKSDALKPDPVQEVAVAALQRLYDDVLAFADAQPQSFFERLRGDKREMPQGVYMYGGVGRGKSMLMDLFYDCLPEGFKARRVHFHEFMIEVHNYINSRSQDYDGASGMVDQALPSLAGIIAGQTTVLCFDEFHVVDITDAMILGRLFKILFEAGVIVVATSNWAPDDLYKDGLQRSRFLPFIKLLKTKVQVVHLDSPHDYRAMTEQVAGSYYTPLGVVTRAKMDALFVELSGGKKVKSQSFTVKGRKIVAERVAGGVARFSFSQLCERPHGAEDYIKIAETFDCVFLEDVPTLGYDRRNEVKRLMNLIDALYEARVKVIISAEAPPHKLYRGREHSYEFERTISRLLEMQSDSYP